MTALASLLTFVWHFGVTVASKVSERLGGKTVVGTINELWPDVPAIPGATKVEGKLPLHMRLITRHMSRGKVNFISYRTDKSAQEVKEFYSVERMKAVGWTPKDNGNSNPEDKMNRGGVCLFSRKDGDKEESLSIVVAQDDNLLETSLFYGRVAVTNTK